MNVVMSRLYSMHETQAALYVLDGIDKLFQCVTLELPKIRIPYPVNSRNVDCIPEGVYPVQKIVSPTKGWCFLLYDVPNRSAVEIHKGNFATGIKVDTQGCILPGMYFDDLNEDSHIDVADSTEAMNKLLEILPKSFNLYII